MPAATYKAYVGPGGRQLHYRCRRGGSDAPPLVVLHPAPSSGLYFTTAMPMLAAGRDVFAPDYPGYGGSDPRGNTPSIADYAAAIGEFVELAGLDGPVDVLGFHTGCLVGVELALGAAELVGRLLLIDVPFFTGAEQAALRDQMSRPLELGDSLDCLAGPFRFNVSSRLGAVRRERAFELFAEHLRAGSGDARAFAAAFDYDCAARFAALRRDVTVIATQSGLLEPSRQAAAALPGARLVEALEIETAVFESSAESIAGLVNAELSMHAGGPS